MNPKQKNRLIIIGLVGTLLAAAVALVLVALQENINAFYSPSDIVKGKAPIDRTLRVGGLVVAGSVKRDPQSLKVGFDLTDGAHQVRVTFSGILPDLFREGQGIVAQGRMRAGVFEADEVLAKHDENYMPPEVQDALDKAQQQGVIDQLRMPHGEGAQ